jgi:predicted  nucleic acid-binding Zn-ribbon protein
MPEAAELARLQEQRVALSDRARDAQIRVEDLTRDQRKADADVEQVKTRRQRDQQRMDQGLVSNPKDLERMQHELASLERRISDLEDAELEVMEQLENAQAELDDLTGRLARIDEEVAEAEQRRAEKAADLEKQVAETRAEREQTAGDMPEDLMRLYTRLREQKGGVGAAALRAKQCGGCRLTLDAAVLGEIARRPADDVVRCEECSRILVRTGESGI